MMRCDDARIQDYLLGGLTLSEVQEVQTHLAACAACTESIEHYRTLFQSLADPPLPAVPEAIAEGVLLRLREPTSWVRFKRRLGAVAGQPRAAAVLGAATGLAIVLFQDSALHLLGRLAGGLLAGWAGALVRAVRSVIDPLTAGTAVLETSILWMVKLRALLHALAEAARLIPEEFPLLSLAAGLILAFLATRRFVFVRRERLGHAEH